MILISHRGNINVQNNQKENVPSYIDLALNKNYDVEVDVHCIENNVYLGHDLPQYHVTYNWLYERRNKLWVHCKNINAVTELQNKDLHYFWHENDTLTLTSRGIIWAYPGNQPIKNSIAVLPELNNDNINKCLGICSDYILNYTNI